MAGALGEGWPWECWRQHRAGWEPLMLTPSGAALSLAIIIKIPALSLCWWISAPQLKALGCPALADQNQKTQSLSLSLGFQLEPNSFPRSSEDCMSGAAVSSPGHLELQRHRCLQWGQMCCPVLVCCPPAALPGTLSLVCQHPPWTPLMAPLPKAEPSKGQLRDLGAVERRQGLEHEPSSLAL